MTTYLPHAFTPEPTLDPARLPASLQAFDGVGKLGDALYSATC
jgi:hypothetical protein